MSNLPEILTLEQTAEFLQVSTRTIQRLVAAGSMPGRRVGSQWRFDRDQLQAWVRGREHGSVEVEPDLRDLVEKESRRLGVDVPETLLAMQRDYAASRRAQEAEEATGSTEPETAER